MLREPEVPGSLDTHVEAVWQGKRVYLSTCGAAASKMRRTWSAAPVLSDYSRGLLTITKNYNGPQNPSLIIKAPILYNATIDPL